MIHKSTIILLCFFGVLGTTQAQDDAFISKLDSLGTLDDSTKSLMAYNAGVDFMNSQKYTQYCIL